MVQSVERSFEILEVVAEGPAGISELARRVGLPTSTVARLLKTLEKLRAVQRRDGIYSLGPTTLALASKATGTGRLADVDRSVLAGLATTLGEVAGLSEPIGHEVVYRDQVDCHNEVRVRDWTGERLAMHVVSSGLVFLAHFPDSEINRYLGGNLRHFTDRTVSEPDRIVERLRQIRRAGYAWTKGEFHAGINSVAAPLFDGEDRLIGAVHSHGPSYRFPVSGSEQQVGAAVAHAAAKISHRLGWRGGLVTTRLQ